jgi:hypothetical protein
VKWRRLIAAGAVRLDGAHALTDPGQRHRLSSGDVVKIGKRRWFRVTFGS